MIIPVGGLPYIEFEGLISQSSTDAPTITWLNPGKGRTITPAYVVPGYYRLDSDVAFDAAKTTFEITNNTGISTTEFFVNCGGGAINIFTYQAGLDTDGLY